MKNSYQKKHLRRQYITLEKELLDSLNFEGYKVWQINIDVNLFPPYAKKISVKLDEDTFININVSTNHIKTIIRMIKDEINLLRLLGFESKLQPIKLSQIFQKSKSSYHHNIKYIKPHLFSE